jgi:hypothetical protein
VLVSLVGWGVFCSIQFSLDGSVEAHEEGRTVSLLRSLSYHLTGISPHVK